MQSGIVKASAHVSHRRYSVEVGEYTHAIDDYHVRIDGRRRQRRDG